MNKFFITCAAAVAGLAAVLHFLPAPVMAKKPIPANAAKAYFAGGCFWCTEADFEKLPGVYEAVSGYAGGKIKNPTYQQVASGRTKYVETVEVYYDPQKVSYDQLLAHFWRHIDPTDGLGRYGNRGQFVDRGPQYRSVIFYANEAEKAAAERSKQQLVKSGKFKHKVVTDIVPLTTFYPAEDYHQDYYRKNPWRYKYYRNGSGRDQFLNRTWKNSTALPSYRVAQNTAETIMTDARPYSKRTYSKPSDEVLRKRLTPLQYNVTQRDATEPPFKNAYHDNKEAGIYVDIVSGEPLFSSLDKFDSGTGWPSFVKPLEPKHITERTDYKLFYPRTEVRSTYGDSHLGHVFKDGPKERGGLRYCINSASLRFIPAKDLEKEGYGEYAHLFANKNAAR